MSNAPAASAAGTAVGVYATFDYGTSRAACGIFDIRAVYGDDGSLPHDGLAQAEKRLGLVPEPGVDRGIAIELETISDAVARAEAWRAVFDTPPLEFNRLRAISDRSSDLVIDGTTVEFADEAAGRRVRWRGLKQRLTNLDEVVPGTRLTGAELFNRVYRRFAELAADELGLRVPIQRFHITFPTRLPPDRRERLREAVAGVAAQVEMNVDEAAAAAGFFIMKRLGADLLLGATAFRLRARCPEGPRAWEQPQLWNSARHWHENMLVVDVGGGTTDVALVRVAIVDVTPAEAGDCTGRYLRLQPEVIASGGRLHLGGDLLTLEVFELLKTKLGIGEDETRFEGIADEVEQTARRQAFDALWQAAELVKHVGLAGAQPCDVRVGPASGTGPGDGTAAIDELLATVEATEPSAVITAQDFGGIVEQVAARVAALAAGIAAGGLRVSAHGTDAAQYRESVDRVVLSGGSMLGEALRGEIEDRLRAELDADGLDSTFELEFDPVYCKTATALGGMFLNSVSDLRQNPNDLGVIEALRRGQSFFDVDTSRLHMNVAADFMLQRDNQAVWDQPAFCRGDKLTGFDADAFATSPRFPVVALVAIHRYDTGLTGGPIQPDTIWGEYNGLDQQLAQTLSGNGVSMRFEIDQDEQITLMLCKGERLAFQLDGAPHALANPPVDGLVHEGALRYGLYLDVFAPASGVHDREPLLAEGEQVPQGGTVVFAGGRRVYCKVPAWMPTAGGQWPGNGAIAREATEYRLLLEMPPGHRWLSVDGWGDVRTHAQRPEFVSVDAPADLLDAPDGTLFRTRLVSTNLYDGSKDPFNGTR